MGPQNYSKSGCGEAPDFFPRNKTHVHGFTFGSKLAIAVTRTHSHSHESGRLKSKPRLRIIRFIISVQVYNVLGSIRCQRDPRRTPDSPDSV